MRRLLTVPLAVALMAFAAGCGETQIDSGKAEDLVKKVAGSGTVKLKSASCPSGIKAKKGADFKCDVEYEDGAKGTITVHQENNDGSIRTAPSDINVTGGQ